MTGDGHPRVEALRAIAGGRPPTPREARHLLRCPACRSRLAAASPDALFALLGALPVPDPAPPLPSLPVERRGTRLLRGGLAAAAAGLLLLLAGALRHHGAGRPPTWPPVEGIRQAAVEAPGARVVTLVPRDPEAPVVTLVFDQEFDL